MGSGCCPSCAALSRRRPKNTICYHLGDGGAGLGQRDTVAAIARLVAAAEYTVREVIPGRSGRVSGGGNPAGRTEAGI